MKKWYKSKTVWVGVAEVLTGSGVVVETFAQSGDFSVVGFLFLVSGLAKVILRAVTSTGVSL